MASRTTPPTKADPKPVHDADPKPVHDTARQGDGNHYALVLDGRPDRDGVPTVPATAHTVFVNFPERGSVVKGQPAGEFLPLPGYYRHDRPTPVGGDGECPLELAITASKQDGCGVTLVQLPGGEVEAHRDAHAQDVAAGRNAVTETAARADDIDNEAEIERLRDEAGATGQEV